MFAPWLHGHRLVTNAPHLPDGGWTRFTRVRNRTWHDGNIVLIGDAAHTAHFSIGSGTKLALEDSIELARCIGKQPADLTQALRDYEAVRSVEVLKIQNAARNSTEWFENVARYVNLPPEQFAYSLLTRSQRISHENLRLRDRQYVELYEDWIAERAGAHRQPHQQPIPPMFTPFTLRGVTLKNRVVVSPMAQYSCVDGLPADYHLVHLGARAMGGAALVMAEMTCPSPDARITPQCPGLWNDAQRDAWARIVAFVHERYEGGDTNDSMAGRLAYHLKKDLWDDKVGLFHNLEYYPSLERLDDFIPIKRRIFNRYTSLLTGLPSLQLPVRSTPFANNINWVRAHYREIMAEIADSDVLNDIVSQIYGMPVTFNKLSFNLGDYIRKSNYALC